MKPSISLIPLLMLAGCGHSPADGSYKANLLGQFPSSKEFMNRIEQGFTQIQVVESVGQPTVISVEDSQGKGEFLWEYTHVSGSESSPRIRTVLVYFQNFKVSKVTAISP